MVYCSGLAIDGKLVLLDGELIDIKAIIREADESQYAELMMKWEEEDRKAEAEGRPPPKRD